VSGLDRHNKRNLSVFTLKNEKSSIHHLLRVLSDFTTRGIWVRLLGKSVLIILHIGIIVWLVCLCLCSSFFFFSCDLYVFFPFNYLPCLYVFQFSILKSWLLWKCGLTSLFEYLLCSYECVLILMRKKTQGAKRFEQQAYPPRKKFAFFPFLFSFPAFNNQKVWFGWFDKYDALGFMTLSVFAWLWWEPFMFAHKLILGYIERMTWSCENFCLWLYSCLYAKNVVIVFTAINDCGIVYDNLKKPMN